MSTDTLSGESLILEFFQTVLRSEVGAAGSLEGTRPEDIKAAGQSNPLSLLEEKVMECWFGCESMKISLLYIRQNAVPV